MNKLNEAALAAGQRRVQDALQKGGRLLYVAQDKAEDLIAMVSMPKGSKQPLRAILVLQRYYLAGLGREGIAQLAAEIIAEAKDK
jgi:hypothetical protein